MRALFFSFIFLFLTEASPQTISTSFFLKVNPKGTYLTLSPSDLAAPATVLDLRPFINDPNIQLKPTDLISLQQVGTYQNTRPEWGGQDIHSDLIAVFMGNQGQFIFPGPNSTLPYVQTVPNYGLPTDIPQDFMVLNVAGYVEMPVGATEIHFSPNESVWFDNSDPNGDFGVWVEFKIIKTNYKIIKTVIGEVDPNNITIAPSIKPCGQLKQTIKSKNILLTCIDVTNNTPVSGCFAQIDLQPGADDGGHNQMTHNSPRPMQFFNRIPINTSLAIPITGLQLTYESPEVSGDVDLKIQGTDPNGNSLQVANTKITVRIPEDTIPLNNIFGFYFDLANMSHQEGIYGTPDFNDRLNKAIGQFRFQLISSSFNDAEIPLIESEGAGLPLGGVFDIQNTWTHPHCTHRDGKTIDISFSTFNNLQITNRKKQLVKRIFLRSMQDFLLRKNPENSTHWHFVGP